MSNWNARCREILNDEDFESRVAELMTAAGQAGDLEQVRLCEVALGCGDCGASATENERREASEECARVLADNEGR
jgi:hypothetical protein